MIQMSVDTIDNFHIHSYRTKQCLVSNGNLVSCQGIFFTNLESLSVNLKESCKPQVYFCFKMFDGE